MSDPLNILLRPSMVSRVHITAVGAILRADCSMLRDEDRPIAPDLKAFAAELIAQADRMEAADAPAPPPTIHECQCCNASTGIVPAGPKLGRAGAAAARGHPDEVPGLQASARRLPDHGQEGHGPEGRRRDEVAVRRRRPAEGGEVVIPPVPVDSIDILDEDGDGLLLVDIPSEEGRSVLIEAQERDRDDPEIAVKGVPLRFGEDAMRKLLAWGQSWIDAPRDAARLAAEAVAEDDGVRGHPGADGAGHHLHAAVVGDELVIRIGVATLAHACLAAGFAWNLLGEHSATLDPREHCKVTDLHGFAEDVRSALLNEAEDGSSKLTNVLDAAMQAAVEDGSLHFASPDDLTTCEECEKPIHVDDAPAARLGLRPPRHPARCRRHGCGRG